MWTADPIHASLTNLDPADEKARPGTSILNLLGLESCRCSAGQVAIGLFRNIQGFMGDYQLLYPELLARDLVREGCHSQELADEVK